MAGEKDTRTDLDISTGKSIGGDAPGESTQTRDGAAAKDGENAQPEAGSTTGTGTDGGGASGDEGSSSTQDGGEDTINPQTGKPWTIDEWRDKFRASAKGAQDLLTQVNTLTGERDQATKKVTDLEKEISDLRQIAEGKNPEGLSARDMQSRLEKATSELALLKENAELDAFEKSVPLAASKRDTLRSLARANPDVSLQKLWDDNLKAGAEAADAADKAKKEAQKKGASEQGKGTSTREPAGGGDTVKGRKGDTGLTLADFNKLPVAERRSLMERYDIR